MVWQERSTAQLTFRQAHPHRRRRRGAPFPLDLDEIPPFATWFEEDIEKEVEEGRQILMKYVTHQNYHHSKQEDSRACMHMGITSA